MADDEDLEPIDKTYYSLAELGFNRILRDEQMSSITGADLGVWPRGPRPPPPPPPPNFSDRYCVFEYISKIFTCKPLDKTRPAPPFLNFHARFGTPKLKC